MYSYSECLSYLLYVVIVHLQSDFPRLKCSLLTYTSSGTTIAQRTRLMFGRQNHGQRDSNLLFGSLDTCLPNPPLPFTSSMPQENVFHCSFFLCFSEDLLCILQNPTQIYFYEAFLSSPRQSCMFPLFTQGRAFYMLEFVYLRHSIDYWRYLSILLAWKRTAQGKTGVRLIFVSPEASTEIDR